MQCPFCKETIQEGAIKCRHCGSMLNAPPSGATSQGMNPPYQQKSFMPIWQSILIAVGILILALVTKVNAVMYLVILGSAIWAAVDSSKLNISQYKSSFCKAPWQVAVGMLLLWIVIFPWYLTFRSKINSGLVSRAV